ncbi:MAG: tRNA pseudouridine(55) synthase TruB [Gimesia sp.]|nr:tRNA pseudouridine(55) synthase TruB [Gimesia sp.]
MSSENAVGLKLSGLLNIHKREGMTSRQVVDRIQKLVKPAKAGHAGTLDPLATGVLVVCIGSATRLIRFVQEQPKEYIGEFILGKRSDTDDISGNVTATPDCPRLTREQLEICLPELTGMIAQVPPQFSAVHIDGQRAYDRARRGETFEIQPRTVEVHELELLDFEFPRFQLRIVCGSGTYVRSLGRDLGEQLGVGAIMTSLVRTRIGTFHLSSAINLDQECSLESITTQLHNPASAVAHLTQYECNERELLHLSQGRKLECHPDQIPADSQLSEIAVITPKGELAAIAEWNRSLNQLSPRQVFFQPAS